MKFKELLEGNEIFIFEFALVLIALIIYSITQKGDVEGLYFSLWNGIITILIIGGAFIILLLYLVSFKEKKKGKRKR